MRRSVDGHARKRRVACLQATDRVWLLERQVTALLGILLEIVELDHVVSWPHDQLIRPLDDGPLQLFVNRERARWWTKLAGRVEQHRHEIHAVELHVALDAEQGQQRRCEIDE